MASSYNPIIFCVNSLTSMTWRSEDDDYNCEMDVPKVASLQKFVFRGEIIFAIYQARSMFEKLYQFLIDYK